MRPMIDDLELPQVQEIATDTGQVFVEHAVPGMDGSHLQGMGQRSARIALWGVALSHDAMPFMETLNSKFREARPVIFIADIMDDARILHVVIEDLRWQEVAGKPQQYVYLLTLRECADLKPVEDDTCYLDPIIADDARRRFDAMVRRIVLEVKC